MKTLTLRLSEVEALALERIAYAYRLSKNKMIKKLIADAMTEFDNTVDIFDDEIEYISSLSCFADHIYNLYVHNEWTSSQEDKEELSKLIRLLKYTLEEKEDGDELKDEQAAEIDKWLGELLECYRNL